MGVIDGMLDGQPNGDTRKKRPKDIKLKHKKIGNIKLIGELYNSQVIKDEIIFSCLETKMSKNFVSEEAYKTIGQVAKELDLVDKKTGHFQTHTLRYWETQFKQIKPSIKAGG